MTFLLQLHIVFKFKFRVEILCLNSEFTLLVASSLSYPVVSDELHLERGDKPFSCGSKKSLELVNFAKEKGIPTVFILKKIA